MSKKVSYCPHWELGQELSLCTNMQEALLCWNMLENLGEDLNKFHQLLSDNGDSAASADVENKCGDHL